MNKSDDVEFVFFLLRMYMKRNNTKTCTIEFLEKADGKRFLSEFDFISVDRIKKDECKSCGTPLICQKCENENFNYYKTTPLNPPPDKSSEKYNSKIKLP